MKNKPKQDSKEPKIILNEGASTPRSSNEKSNKTKNK